MGNHLSNKEQLEQFQIVLSALKDLEESRQLFLTMATKVTPTLTAETKGGSGNSRKIETYAIKLAEINSAIEQERAKLFQMFCPSLEAINLLPEGNEKRVLHNRYLLGKSIKQTAELMNYSQQHIYYLQKKAFEKIEQMEKDKSQ